MRRLLIAACAVAPLALAAGVAHAQTTVSNARTTPIATSSSGNIDIAAGGSVTVPAAGGVVTLDSSNTITNEGSITSNNTDNAVGVLIRGGNTGSFTNTGQITVSEDYTASDTTNADGIPEAPFATGTGKVGVQVVGASAFTGDLTLGGAGILVKGNNSYGVSIEAPLTGNLFSTAPITVTGDATTGVRVLAPVSGLVSLGGTVTVNGAGARAVDVEAPVGSLRIYSALTSTGYSSSARTTTNLALGHIQATPLDLQQSGATVTVAANLPGGLFIAAAPAGTVSGTLADLDGDGVADGVEGTGSVTNFGTAPAVLVGAAGKTITLGAFGADPNAYGFINRGSINGSGVYDGVTATALQIGLGGAVNIAGGLNNIGTITATAFEADATGVHIQSGSSIPVFLNSGGISATVSDSTLSTGFGGGSGRSVLIDAGATVPSLINSGVIATQVVGNSGLTAAVVDNSGTLSNVVNQGVITATRSATDASTALTGASVALDLRNNTTGVTFVQQLNPNPNLTAGSTSGTTDTAVTAVTATTPELIGDVYLGSGPNSVSILAGTFSGALDLGSNTASLTIDGGAIYFGSLRYSGSALALSVVNGQLNQLTPVTLKLSTLNLGSASLVNLAVDPLNNTATFLQVAGAATIANGAKIGVNLVSAITTPKTFTLIRSPNLTVGSTDANLLASSSFLVTTTLHTDLAAGTVNVTLTPRSPADLGLNASEGSALAQVVAGAGGDAAVSGALLASQDSTGFSRLYRQLLPEHGDGVFLAVDQATRTIADLSTEHQDLFHTGAQEGGLWLQQFLLGLRQDKDVGAASETAGFGLVGGLSTSDSNIGAFGLSIAYVNAETSDPDLVGNGSTNFSQAEGGLNWRTTVFGLDIAARGGGGYLWGVTRRQFVADATALTSAVNRSSKGTWNAWTADARFSASHRFNLGRYFVQPQVKADYVRLDQDGYLERFGGNGLNLNVGSRGADEASGTASIVFGMRMGLTGAIRPTFELGVRDVFEGDAGAVNAAFTGAGSQSFSLSATPITGAGGIARFGLKYTGAYVDVEVAAKAEAFKTYQEGDLRVAVSTRF